MKFSMRSSAEYDAFVLGACRGEFVSRTQPLPLVAAQFQTGFAEP